MCGICGYYHRGAQTPDQNLLEQMNSTLIHRGPDSEGYFVDPPVGLAMRRLAVIDLKSGAQPMFNEDKTVVTVFNGEIYNFQDLRADLQKRGHVFSTSSDTEVIVHGYEEWGDEMLERFNAMFALALWDGKNKRLLLARDHMGQKPLLWHESHQGLFWASEAKALLKVPSVSREIRPEAVHHYLTLQYVPDPLHIYRDLQKLPAAHKLVIENNTRKISRWWKLRFIPKLSLSQQDAETELREKAARVVKRCMISDVPLGLFLSGGIDSSVLASIMAESGRLKTYSIGFEEPGYSEAPFARIAARHFGTEHQEFTFTSANLLSTLECLGDVWDEPLADPACLPLYELARQARSSVTVAITGDGGDETMAGYQRYLLDSYLAPYAKLPPIITQRMVPWLLHKIPEFSYLPEDRNPITGLKRLAQFAATTSKASIVRWGSYFSEAEKMRLYNSEWQTLLRPILSENLIAAAYDSALADTALDRTLGADQDTYLAGDLLPKTDLMTMASSLEARAPFLDRKWVEWTAQLPPAFKVRGFETKYLLRKAFSRDLPQPLVSRGKQGFSLPLGVWFRGILKPWLYDLLMDKPILGGALNSAEVKRLIQVQQEGRRNVAKKLWALAVLALWERRQ